MNKNLLSSLICPKCGEKLIYYKEKEVLICKKCELYYLIDNGIPILLLEKAKSFSLGGNNE